MARALLLAALFSAIFTTTHGMGQQKKSFSELSKDAHSYFDTELNKANLKACASACRAFYQQSLETNTRLDPKFLPIMASWAPHYPRHMGIVESQRVFHKSELKSFSARDCSRSNGDPSDYCASERLQWATEIKLTIEEIHEFNKKNPAK